MREELKGKRSKQNRMQILILFSKKHRKYSKKKKKWETKEKMQSITLGVCI